jgi:hypothetical protein
MNNKQLAEQRTTQTNVPVALNLNGNGPMGSGPNSNNEQRIPNVRTIINN